MMENLQETSQHFEQNVTSFKIQTFNKLDGLETNVEAVKQQTKSNNENINKLLLSNVNLASLVTNESKAIKDKSEENNEITRNNSAKLLEIEMKVDKMINKFDEMCTAGMSI